MVPVKLFEASELSQVRINDEEVTRKRDTKSAQRGENKKKEEEEEEEEKEFFFLQ